MMGCTCSWDGGVEKSLGKCPLKDRRSFEGNLKFDLRETGCEDGRWMELAEDRAQRYHSINYWSTRGRKSLKRVVK
jgi:hypothetical protein